MADCCLNDKLKSETYPRKQICPHNNKNYTLVALKTVLQHIKKPWQSQLKEQGYYFCDDPDCDIAYFSQDGGVIIKQDIYPAVVDLKNSKDMIICYCFDIKKSDIELNPSLKDFVIEQTKLSHCSCETSNPSGRCCLKDFPKIA